MYSPSEVKDYLKWFIILCVTIFIPRPAWEPRLGNWFEFSFDEKWTHLVLFVYKLPSSHLVPVRMDALFERRWLLSLAHHPSFIPSSQENNWQSPLFLLDIKKPRFLCSITWWFKWTVMCLVCLVLERAQAKQIEVGARGVKFPPGSWKTRSPFRHAFCLFLLELIWHGRLEWSIHKTRQNKHRSSFTPRRPHCLKQSLPG